MIMQKERHLKLLRTPPTYAVISAKVRGAAHAIIVNNIYRIISYENY